MTELGKWQTLSGSPIGPREREAPTSVRAARLGREIIEDSYYVASLNTLVKIRHSLSHGITAIRQ
jgi:hypothetical protein